MAVNDLTKPIGDLARAAGAVKDADYNAALKVQERASALGLALGVDGAKAYFSDKKNLAALEDDASWKAIKTLNGVTPEHEAAAGKIVASQKGVPDGVPRLGQIFTNLGMVSTEVTQALLAAQSGKRAHDFLNNALEGKAPAFTPAPALKGDPAFLMAAQELAVEAAGVSKNIVGESYGPGERPGAQSVVALKAKADAVLSDAATRLKAAGLGKFAAEIEADVASRATPAPAPKQAHLTSNYGFDKDVLKNAMDFVAGKGASTEETVKKFPALNDLLAGAPEPVAGLTPPVEKMADKGKAR
ncbi:MAG: hypothetical protein V4735_07250 [Pseudomonadota bacterium]